MSDLRNIALDPARVRLKIATKALIKAAGGTELAGEIAGVRQQRISDCSLPNTGDFLRVSEAVAIEDYAPRVEGWPHVTRAMARHHGFALLPLPETRGGETEWHRAMGKVSREVGDVVGRLCEALADDDRVSADEIRAKRIIEEIDQAVDGLAQLRGMAVAELENGRTKGAGK